MVDTIAEILSHLFSSYDNLWLLCDNLLLLLPIYCTLKVTFKTL